MTASGTACSFLPIDIEAVLKRSGVSVRIDVVPYGTAVLINCLIKDLFDVIEQLHKHVKGNAISFAVRPNSRPEQRFVRVNIPYPRNHGLIQQERLYARGPLAHGSGQGFG